VQVPSEKRVPRAVPEKHRDGQTTEVQSVPGDVSKTGVHERKALYRPVPPVHKPRLHAESEGVPAMQVELQETFANGRRKPQNQELETLFRRLPN